MDVQTVPRALRERLGPEATIGLLEWSEMTRHEWTTEIVTSATRHFDGKLAEEMSKGRAELATAKAELRVELATGLAGVRQEIATTRVELLKWSFLFWVGQVLAMLGILSVLLRR